MKPRKPLKRYTPVKKKRVKPRRGQPTKEEKAHVREQRRAMAGGRCEIRLHKQCWKDRILPPDGDVFNRGHLVHLKSRGSGGSWDLANLRWGCPPCHLGSMHTEGKKIDDQS